MDAKVTAGVLVGRRLCPGIVRWPGVDVADGAEVGHKALRIRLRLPSEGCRVQACHLRRPRELTRMRACCAMAPRAPAPARRWRPRAGLLDVADRLRLWSRTRDLRVAWHAQAERPWQRSGRRRLPGRGRSPCATLDFLRWRFDRSPLLKRGTSSSAAMAARPRGFACRRGSNLHVLDAGACTERRVGPSHVAALLRAARAAGAAGVGRTQRRRDTPAGVPPGSSGAIAAVFDARAPSPGRDS